VGRNLGNFAVALLKVSRKSSIESPKICQPAVFIFTIMRVCIDNLVRRSAVLLALGSPHSCGVLWCLPLGHFRNNLTFVSHWLERECGAAHGRGRGKAKLTSMVLMETPSLSDFHAQPWPGFFLHSYKLDCRFPLCFSHTPSLHTLATYHTILVAILSFDT